MVEKSDYLFLILGTNPMPNLIAISNRVKENGKVFFIVTDSKNGSFSSKSIGESIKKILKDKKIKLLSVDKNDEENIRNILEEKYSIADFFCI